MDGRCIQDHFPGIGRYVVNLARAMIPLLDGHERLILLRDPTQPSPDLIPLVAPKCDRYPPGR